MTPQQARAIAASLLDAVDVTQGERLCFDVGGKGFAWGYLRREQKNKPRVLQPEVLAIACSIERKEMLIEAAADIYFDDDHYRGYPAVLVRLAVVGEAELRALLEDALRMKAGRKSSRHS
ncbi:MAG TPA: MmcQ/YjbR family DNA-binding protein [Caulobacteraceae bacterium]|nr:MmcQ/YjbR family DNA-binding protein [Caulobacteraceae bacterium]